jgi:hypothetical protein
MEQTELTLAFENVAARLAFTDALENAKLGSEDPFRVVLPTDTQNIDNELLQLFITFMENGGPIAIAAFVNLLRDILKKSFPDRIIVVSHGKKKAQISSKTSDEEAKKIARDLASR